MSNTPSGSTPVSSSSDYGFEFQAIRSRLVQNLLLVTSIAGLAVTINSTIAAIQRQAYISAAFFVFAFTTVVVMTIWRSLPFLWRIGSLLFMLYMLGVQDLLDSGLSGESGSFLILFTAFCWLFVNWKVGVGALVLSTLTSIGIGVAMNNGLIPLPAMDRMATSGDMAAWGISTFVLILTSLMISAPFDTLISQLRRTLVRRDELVKAVQDERSGMDEKIQQRTQDVQRRLEQLRTASDISRTISSMLDPTALLQEVVELIKARFDLYYVGIFLIDEKQEYAVLRAGSGAAGTAMIADGHRLVLGGTSMIGWCAINQKPRIALDVGEEAVRFNNPYLPLTRSELALPIISRGRVLGALSIQSALPNAFDEGDILVLEGVADSLAIALVNAQLFQEAQVNLEEVRILNRDYLLKAWTETIGFRGALEYTYENPLKRSENQGNVIQVPLTLREQAIGQLSLETDADRLSEDEQNFVDAVIVQTALALENARLLEQTQQRAAQEEKINQLSSQFSRAVRIEEILKIAVKELGQLPNVAEVSVQLNPGGESLVHSATDEKPAQQKNKGNGSRKESAG